jgi:hypothetical protein
MRQNRVDPCGALSASAARGGWMGNRGCLHDDQGRILRRWQGRRWICCVLAFKGRRRALMQPGRYTELFFLDEATAAAAGHRPCAECRRAEWTAFRALWAQVHGAAGAEGIDRVLHAARTGPRPVVTSVPEGAMVWEGAPLLWARGGWWRWSHQGYTEARAPQGAVPLLTPEPLARLMAAGWRVQVALAE